LGRFAHRLFLLLYDRRTAATLYVHGLPLVSGEQAALAIKPFAGELAGVLFAARNPERGLYGIGDRSLSTAYAFAEFFGLSGSLTFIQAEQNFLYFVYFSIGGRDRSDHVPRHQFVPPGGCHPGIERRHAPLVLYYLIQLTAIKN